VGNYYILLPVTAEEAELRVADLYEYGTTGIAEIEEADGSITLKASFEDAASAAAFGVPVLEDTTDWIATSHRAWASRLVGERFFFAPSWSDEPTPPGRWRIDYQDGAACGSGEHPSTRQTLVAMEEVLQPGMRVIDLGCGAGILSLGAKYLEASFVAGLDVEWDSCQLTRKLSGVPVIHGTADCLRGGQFDIVAANISATVLVNYADAILTLVKPGGRVILAGFATEEASIVKSVFGATSLNERIEGEWSCLVLDLDTSDLL
jgi:ribosomal protein L11 methyltransferase